VWIAELAREQLDVDPVLLIPAAVPPHKGAGSVAPYSLRLEMVRRVAESRPGLAASDLEADPSRPSYTVESLRTLRGRLSPGDEIWLLVGADSLRDLPLWRAPEEIVALANLGIYGRPGYPGEVPAGAVARWIEGPSCGLSSTWIRERLKSSLSVAEFVPAEIFPLLLTPGVYRGG
jgi:nicotinate-nucleotide adenylyltransferase